MSSRLWQETTFLSLLDWLGLRSAYSALKMTQPPKLQPLMSQLARAQARSAALPHRIWELHQTSKSPKQALLPSSGLQAISKLVENVV